MDGPIRRKLKKKLKRASDGERRRILMNSPLIDEDIDLTERQKIRLMEEMKSAGGCCSAAEAAQAIRNNRRKGQTYK